MSQKLTIKLIIGGKEYPLTIDREKEEKYRRAEKETNDWISRFESRYRGDRIDHLAMTALQFAIIHIDAEMSKNMDSDRDKLEKLDRDLDKYLNSFK